MEWNDLLRILLIVCPLVFLGGIVDAVVYGGGGLITLPAYLLAGLDPHAASATNKCGNVWGTLLSAFRFWRRGDPDAQRRLGRGRSPGGGLGGSQAEPHPAGPVPLLHHAGHRSGDGRLSPFKAGLRNGGPLRRSPRSASPCSPGNRPCGGVLRRIFRPRAGTFLMLAYTSLCKFDLLTASGNTKAANAASNAASPGHLCPGGRGGLGRRHPCRPVRSGWGYVGSGLALRGEPRSFALCSSWSWPSLTVRLIFDLAD